MDGSVQVGGTNVYPARITALLVAQPGIAAATVRLMRPEEGHRLKAFIVSDSELSPETLRERLEAWIEAHLAAVERPKALTFGPSLPVDAHGDASDW